jgi:hypothetical protein
MRFGAERRRRKEVQEDRPQAIRRRGAVAALLAALPHPAVPDRDRPVVQQVAAHERVSAWCDRGGRSVLRREREGERGAGAGRHLPI